MHQLTCPSQGDAINPLAKPVPLESIELNPRGRLWTEVHDGKRRKLQDGKGSLVVTYCCDVCDHKHHAQSIAIPDGWKVCGCGVQVHIDCYCGVVEKDSGSMWACDVCRAGLLQHPRCHICGESGVNQPGPYPCVHHEYDSSLLNEFYTYLITIRWGDETSPEGSKGLAACEMYAEGTHRGRV